MIKTYYDAKLNTVFIEFLGKIDPSQGEKYYSDLQKILPREGRGFRVLTDFSGADKIDLELRETIKKVMDLLNRHGVTQVLRVIPDADKDIGLNIMSLFHYSKDVQFLTLQSRAEADERLKN